MSRPLRLDFAGSFWHITHRGNERRPIFFADADRLLFLDILGEAVERFKWIVTAYALMLNHFHLVVEQTQDDTLSRGMKWLSGKYVHWLNRRHDRVGHLFQGRFKSFLIHKETYFLEVLRYVVLNPVRAGVVATPADCTWTSYPATSGLSEAPEWLDVDEVLSHFAGYRTLATELYRQFVADGVASPHCPWDALAGGMYLGPEDWLARVQDRIESRPRSNEHRRAERQLLRPTIAEIMSAVATTMAVPEERIRRGHGGMPRALAAWIGCYEATLTNVEIAAALRLRSHTQVTNLVNAFDRELKENLVLRECVDHCVATLRRKNWQLQT